MALKSSGQAPGMADHQATQPASHFLAHTKTCQDASSQCPRQETVLALGCLASLPSLFASLNQIINTLKWICLLIGIPQVSLALGSKGDQICVTRDENKVLIGNT